MLKFRCSAGGQIGVSIPYRVRSSIFYSLIGIWRLDLRLGFDLRD
jgi:hypothetical protein